MSQLGQDSDVEYSKNVTHSNSHTDTRWFSEMHQMDFVSRQGRIQDPRLREENIDDTQEGPLGWRKKFESHGLVITSQSSK